MAPDETGLAAKPVAAIPLVSRVLPAYEQKNLPQTPRDHSGSIRTLAISTGLDPSRVIEPFYQSGTPG
jgi:hypothetical protein